MDNIDFMLSKMYNQVQDCEMTYDDFLNEVKGMLTYAESEYTRFKDICVDLHQDPHLDDAHQILFTNCKRLMNYWADKAGVLTSFLCIEEDILGGSYGLR